MSAGAGLWGDAFKMTSSWADEGAEGAYGGGARNLCPSGLGRASSQSGQVSVVPRAADNDRLLGTLE